MKIDKIVVDSSGSPTTVEITYEKDDKFLGETIDDSIKLKVRVSRLPTTNSFTYVGHSVDVLTGGAYTPAIIRKFTVPNMTKQAYETLGKVVLFQVCRAACARAARRGVAQERRDAVNPRKH